jgi:hypothetical protein
MTETAQQGSTRQFGGCSVIAAAAFGVADRLGIALTPGYSVWSDAISELAERGAAAKHVVDPFLLLYHALAKADRFWVAKEACA